MAFNNWVCKFVKRTHAICNYTDKPDAVKHVSDELESYSMRRPVTPASPSVRMLFSPPVCNPWPTRTKGPKPQNPRTLPRLLRLPSNLLSTSTSLPSTHTRYANKKESALGARSPGIHYSSSLMFIRAAHAALQFHCSKEFNYR